VLALLWLGHRDPVPATSSRLAPTASATLGFAAGVGTFLEFAGSSPYATRTVVLLALAGGFGTVAARRLRVGWCAAAALTGAAAAWSVAVYANGWTAQGWSQPSQTSDLVATLAFLPLSACVVADARVLFSNGQLALVRTSAAASLGAALGWLVPATFPYVVSWLPQLAVLLACLMVAAVSGHIARAAPWPVGRRLRQDGRVVTVRYFASARAAAGVAEETLDVPTLAALRKELVARSDRLARVVGVASFLVDGQAWREPDAALPASCTVDVLPPFAGG
jgi:molybdopterin converting factor small subunit